MAELYGNLWEHNLCRVIVVDVTDDYRYMQSPMPSDFYPVLTEKWLPRHNLARMLSKSELVTGYLYDWHESPDTEIGEWYVGLVSQDLALSEIRA